MEGKIGKLEGRLASIGELIPQCNKVMKMVLVNRYRSESRSGKCNCKLEAMEVEKRYSEEMKRLTDSYENKLSLIMSEIKDMATTSSTSKEHRGSR